MGGRKAFQRLRDSAIIAPPEYDGQLQTNLACEVWKGAAHPKASTKRFLEQALARSVGCKQTEPGTL